MIALYKGLAVAGIIAAVAYPSYQEQVAKSRRGDCSGAQASSRSGRWMPWRCASMTMERRNSVPIWWPRPRDQQWTLTTTSHLTSPNAAAMSAS